MEVSSVISSTMSTDTLTSDPAVTFDPASVTFDTAVTSQPGITTETLSGEATVGFLQDPFLITITIFALLVLIGAVMASLYAVRKDRKRRREASSVGHYEYARVHPVSRHQPIYRPFGGFLPAKLNPHHLISSDKKNILPV